MKALILCAGKGTRLGLKKTPKCMVKVNGKPILEHLVNHLNKAGITEIIVNVHKDYEKIFEYFGTRLLYLFEPTLLGEDGTEKILSKWLGDEYIVMNGDTLTDIYIKDLIRYPRTTFFYIERYGGTKFVRKNVKLPPIFWDGDGAYYFDCNTPAKLARARRFFKK
jgi:NDP-sugar pyrophosphorylase family protein